MTREQEIFAKLKDKREECGCPVIQENSEENRLFGSVYLGVACSADDFCKKHRI